MNILVPLAVAACILAMALRFYPRDVARVCNENDRDTPPCVQFADNRDFVESRTHVVFAHHFAAVVLGNLIIEGFVVTTVDTAGRLYRYPISATATGD